MKPSLEKVITIARRAGQMILQQRTQGFSVATKHDKSPVTEADQKANDFIVHALQTEFEEIPIVAEESDAPSFDQRKAWQRLWLVDPLDGTKEYIKGSNEFTVNIALVENGKPVLGVVFAPAMNALYYADADSGSWRVLGAGTPERLATPEVKPPYRVVLSRSHPSPMDEEFLDRVRVSEVVRAGSSLKFCAVAEGRADLYPRFTPCMEWDVAAGDAIYRYARISGENASPLQYNKPLLKNGPFVIGNADHYDLPESGVILLTGLSGSGKTTIAQALCDRLNALGFACDFLDGDKLREEFPQTDFSRKGRTDHLMRAGARARELAEQKRLVVLSLIAPYADARQALRESCKKFWEIHVATPLAVCEARDVKGLYAKARAGQIQHFTGIDDPYEEPKNPDLRVDTSNLPLEASILWILEKMAG